MSADEHDIRKDRLVDASIHAAEDRASLSREQLESALAQREDQLRRALAEIEDWKKLAGIQRWRIWSIEHSAWWAPNSWGYTKDLQQAGTYSTEQAIKITDQANLHCADGIPNEAMCPIL